MNSFAASANPVLIIDTAVDNYQSLLAGVRFEADVILLSPQQDGVEQITQALGDRHNIPSLHILSHGESGQLQLGNARLDSHSLERYKTAIATWAKALAADAEVLLYGCKVAAGAWGQQFVQQLSDWLNAPIAASTTLTGSAALGGNWELEFATGFPSNEQPSLAFQSAAMAAYDSVLVTFLNETFTGGDVTDPNWLFGVDQPNNATRANPFLTARSTVAPSPGGLPGNAGVPDPVGQGVLRLTNTSTDQAAFVLYNRALPANAGLEITFDLFAYGGTGADGLSFFLIDGAASPTTAGAFGGSLGYANRTVPTVEAGVQGGFLGVGFDEFGNFSNPTEGRTGTGAGSGFVPDAVAIRGGQASGYTFLTNSVLPFSIDTPGAGATREAARRRVQIDITQTGLLTVQIDGNQDNDFDDLGERPITNFNVTGASGQTPETLKFGFAASTGDSTNFHEIRNLAITPISDAPETANASLNLQPSTTAPVTGLSATDANGIASFTILTLPDPTQGRLFLGNPASGGTPIAAGQSLTPGQINQVFFQATSTFTRLTQFTYTGVDTVGAEDATPGIVSVAPVGVPVPPIDTPPVPLPPLDDFPEGDERRGCRTEFIEGSRNNRRLIGRDGFIDVIRGSQGNDRIRGAGCPDRLNGRGGNDNIAGNAASDRVRGRRGNDRIRGNAGNDLLVGNQGFDVVRGGDGSDTINAGLGHDRVNGGLGNDNIRTRRGRDKARGGRGRDVIRTQQSDDVLLGGRGNDRLVGGGGDDVLVGGRGIDTLIGRAGSDTFSFRSVRDRGDIIVDFETSRDLINVRPILSRSAYGSGDRFGSYIRLVQVGSNTVVRIDGNGDAPGGFGRLATLQGIAPSDLSASNFNV
ncbi:MAG: DUF4347 domain-containing protein [Oculatellaceae cyanobacterium Prado106]|jgi:hypothetical protein|nr:DUF4347 domain-containing protein [Oculatellaceae cyanobacterium Prado106]